MILIIILALIGATCGAITAGGLFSLITTVKIINRYAEITDTVDNIIWYEESVIIGASVCNALYMLNFRINAGVGIGTVACVFFGLLAGMFVGTFLISLAETVKGLPIFLHRMKLSTGLGYVITAIAFGKALGQMLYYLYLY